MSNKKVSQLPEAVQVAGGDLLMIVQGGISKKVPVALVTGQGITEVSEDTILLPSASVVSVNANAGDINITMLAAEDPESQQLTFHREDATANKINLLVVAGTIMRMASFPDALTGQDETLILLPKKTANNWIKII